MVGLAEVTKRILDRAGRDDKFRAELIDKLEEKARKVKAQFVLLEKTIKAVKKKK